MGSGPAIASISIGTKTIQKVRIRIIPFIFILYIVAFLDRSGVRKRVTVVLGGGLILDGRQHGSYQVRPNPQCTWPRMRRAHWLLAATADWPHVSRASKNHWVTSLPRATLAPAVHFK